MDFVETQRIKRFIFEEIFDELDSMKEQYSGSEFTLINDLAERFERMAKDCESKIQAQFRAYYP